MTQCKFCLSFNMAFGAMEGLYCKDCLRSYEAPIKEDIKIAKKLMKELDKNGDR